MKQKSSYLLIFSLLLMSAISNAQTITETYLKAQQLYNDSNYKEAAVCYDRVAFFDTTGTLKDTALLCEANCYFKLHAYTEALQIYNNLYKPYKVNVRAAAFWGITYCQFELKQFNNALTTLSLCNLKLDSSSQKKYLFYKSIAQLACAYYDDAQENLMRYIGDSVSKKADSIRGLIVKLQKQQVSKISRVKYLSMILPGSGQIVLGNYWNGLNSLLLNAALIAVTVNTSMAYAVYDGLLTVAPWWMRYYRGGVRNAGLQAEHKKEAKINKLIQDIIVLITP